MVGAFLAGLAVNAAVHDKPAKGKLEFFANSLFIPICFIVTGFLIDLARFCFCEFRGKEFSTATPVNVTYSCKNT
jgi:hypothetical protein